MPRPYTIAAVAAAAGVHVETVRYYQRLRLVPEPPRPLGGVRRYTEADAERLRFIKRAQVLGFTLEEIGSLLELDEAHGCAETRELASHKLKIIETKLADLMAMRKALGALLRQCDAGAMKGNCPIIHALAAD